MCVRVKKAGRPAGLDKMSCCWSANHPSVRKWIFDPSFVHCLKYRCWCLYSSAILDKLGSNLTKRSDLSASSFLTLCNGKKKKKGEKRKFTWSHLD